MTFRVEYAPRSVRDLEKIRTFLDTETATPDIAVRFLARLLDACDSLHTLPERFPRYPHAREWRMMPFGNYLVFFRVHGEAVRIGHIRHAARRPFRG